MIAGEVVSPKPLFLGKSISEPVFCGVMAEYESIDLDGRFKYERVSALMEGASFF